MPKILIRSILLPLGIIALFFVGLLYVNNGSQLVIQMHSKDQHILHPQLYYAKQHEAYSEAHSLHADTVKKDRYIFSLPALDTIAHLRFDPAARKTAITINHIMLVRHHWFSTVYATIPLDALKPLFQIDSCKHNGKTLSFVTTGNDSQCMLNLMPKERYYLSSWHPQMLLTALIGYLLLVFIIQLYRRYRNDTLPTAKIILYTLFFALTVFKTFYYKDHIRFSYPPDELAHLSYIVSVHEHHHFIPDYEHMVMLNNKHQGNYLSHPPLYYELINLVYNDHLSPKENVQNFRAFSLLLFLLAFMLILYIGFRADLSILGDFVFLSLVSSIPMYAYTGASISNDTLAILGAAVFVIGLKQLLEKNYATTTYLLIALGVFLAYFSKLTAAILIFFALLFYLFYLLFTKTWIKINTLQIAILSAVLIPIVYYQLSITLHYHALVPTFNVTHPAQYLHSPFFVPEQYRQHLTPVQWFERMAHYIEGGWFGIHSHHSFTKASWLGYSGLLVLHIFAIAALFLPCSKTETSHSFCLLGKMTLLALFSVLAVQYLFSYKAHLHSGYLGGLQPRYLLPFMFSFGIMASIFTERFKKSFLFTLFIVLVCIQAIYSDFFYFLQYYR